MDTQQPPTALPRGDRTREALISAAIDAFGRDGFSATRTRTIAAAASVNQALIGYHFGGKRGLYTAALEHIVTSIRARMQPVVTAIETELGLGSTFGAGAPDGVTPAAAQTPDARERHLGALYRLLDAFVVVVTSEESALWARLVLREQQDPTPGFDILYDGIMRPLFNVTATLIARIRHADPAAIGTRLLTVTVLAQVLIFRMARAAVARQLEWDAMGAAEVAAVQNQVRSNVAAILGQETDS